MASRKPNIPALVGLAAAGVAVLAAALFAILLVLLNGYQDFGFWVIPMIVLWMAALVTVLGVGVRVARRLSGR